MSVISTRLALMREILETFGKSGAKWQKMLAITVGACGFKGRWRVPAPHFAGAR